MADSDKLSSGTGQFDAAWNWKGAYVSGIGTPSGGVTPHGYEKFGQLSATPDSTALFAGPARFTGITGATSLTPIGMVDGLNLSQDGQVARLFEIGSNRSYFTRGKTISSVSFSRMLADTPSMIKVFSENARKAFEATTGVYNQGFSAAGAEENANVFLNFDSEITGVPFGVMLLFKTRGGDQTTRGNILAAVYLEYCMFNNLSLGVNSGSPVIQEGVSISFDRVVPVLLK